VVFLRPFLIALRFLTRLPVPWEEALNDRDLGRSALYYPPIGLLIGLLLWALDFALSHQAVLLRAAVLLAFWVLLTGALHLDGLADSADAWLGGFGDRERTLLILKDPCSGPAALVAVFVVLILKFAALASILDAGERGILILSPLLGRTALALLFLTTSYVRPGGLGETLARHLPRPPLAFVALAALAAALFSTGAKAGWILLVAGGCFLGLRAMMVRRIGGTTGDTAGALVEVIETAVLVALSIV